jgi:molybdopterin-binding protein
VRQSGGPSRRDQPALETARRARNVLKGKIVAVTKGQTTSHVVIDVNGMAITASITNEAVDELKLARSSSLT